MTLTNFKKQNGDVMQQVTKKIDVPSSFEAAASLDGDDTADPALERSGPRILLVDPDDFYRSALSAYLRNQEFDIVECADPENAAQLIESDDQIDAAVIDIDSPGMEDMDLLVHLRDAQVQIPVALASTVTGDDREAAALAMGASDFLNKSRSPSIVAKRLRLLVNGRKSRSSSPRGSSDQIAVGPLNLSLRSHRAYWNGNEVPLTITEFRIVRLLAQRVGENASYRKIYDVVHGSGFQAGDGPEGYRSNVRSLIRKIRGKFRAIDTDFDSIENAAGLGYRWRTGDGEEVEFDEAPEDDEAAELPRPTYSSVSSVPGEMFGSGRRQ